MRCTCTWYASIAASAGRKHVLAVQHAPRGARRMSVSDRLLGDRDLAEVRDEMIALEEPERRKRARDAQAAFQETARRRPCRSHPVQALAGRDRVVGTATARKIATDWWRISFPLSATCEFEDDVYAVMAARGSAFFGTVARGLLRDEGGWGCQADRASRGSRGRHRAAGGRRVSPSARHGHRLVLRHDPENIDATYDGLVADPLLEDEVWQRSRSTWGAS